MDEKERGQKSISDRANKYLTDISELFNKNSYWTSRESGLVHGAYIQGALDQDPISRKAERKSYKEGILSILALHCDEAIPGTPEETKLSEIYKIVEALP